MSLWHASCFILLSGCLYVGPPWEKPVNEGPIILSPAATSGNTLVIVGDSGKVGVVARDPDGDPLHFEWWVPGDALGPVEDVSPEPGVQASTATIHRDSRLNGHDIHCVVTDYVNVGVQVSWTVEVWE